MMREYFYWYENRKYGKPRGSSVRRRRFTIRSLQDAVRLPDQTLDPLHLLTHTVVTTGYFEIICQAFNGAEWLPQLMDEFNNLERINRRRVASSGFRDLGIRGGRVGRKLLDHASVKRSDQHCQMGQRGSTL
jgi:hypothetical protein